MKQAAVGLLALVLAGVCFLYAQSAQAAGEALFGGRYGLAFPLVLTLIGIVSIGRGLMKKKP